MTYTGTARRQWSRINGEVDGLAIAEGRGAPPRQVIGDREYAAQLTAALLRRMTTLALPGREQATTNEARDLSAADSARPLPRPGSVSGRLLEVLREHACGWSPCGVGCEQDIMAALRAKGIMLADFGIITGHDED